MNDLVHIASLLVQVLPEKRALTEAAILEFSGAEIAHGDERGRLIVTLEAPSESEILQNLTDIQLLAGVVSASLVYHQTDGGPDPVSAGI